MEQYSVMEGDRYMQLCVQFIRLSGDMEYTFWEDFPVTITTVDGSAVGMIIFLNVHE